MTENPIFFLSPGAFSSPVLSTISTRMPQVHLLAMQLKIVRSKISSLVKRARKRLP